MERSRVCREGAQTKAFDLWMGRRPGDKRVEQEPSDPLLAPVRSDVHRQLSSMRLPFPAAWLEVDESHHFAIHFRQQQRLRWMLRVLANPHHFVFQRNGELLRLANVVCALG